MKHSLATTGLSLSQAQSVSNLCNQRVRDIKDRLAAINNSSKTIIMDGHSYTQQSANPMPDNVIELLKEKARLSATQAFLMENIREKDTMLKTVRNRDFDFGLHVAFPERKSLMVPAEFEEVGESWGWDQLTAAEYNEYLEVEAYASHIGQFIHKDGELDSLRKNLPRISELEWITIKDGERTPVRIHKHHTPEQLLMLHEELAAMHREYEQRVNYFKAKVKNLTTAENARIARVNADAIAEADAHNKTVLAEHETARQQWYTAEKKARFEFQEQIETEINRIAALRIQVPARFQPVVDMFITKESK